MCRNDNVVHVLAAKSVHVQPRMCAPSLNQMTVLVILHNIDFVMEKLRTHEKSTIQQNQNLNKKRKSIRGHLENANKCKAASVAEQRKALNLFKSADLEACWIASTIKN